MGVNDVAPKKGGISVSLPKPTLMESVEDFISEVSEEEKEIEAILKESRVLETDNYEDDVVVISITNGNETFEFGTLGNFSLIKGKAKSKKTFLMCLVMAAAISDRVGIIKGDLPPDKRKIVLFDTEMSKYHVLKRLKAVGKIASSFKNIEVYSLRKYTPEKRLKTIEYYLSKHTGIGLVVIDGIRDLIYDINDSKESGIIVSKLLEWTATYKCHIINVLHENKGNTDPRGHLGTEILNKSETVVSVTVQENKDVSVVESDFVRDKHFPKFYFRINDGIPEIIEDYEMKGPIEKKKSFDPYSILPERHHEVLRLVFKDGGLRYGELQSRLKVEFAAYSINLSGNKAQDLITYYQNKMGWIKHNGLQAKAAKYFYPTTLTTSM